MPVANRLRGGQVQLQRIDLFVVHPEAIAQVRPRSQARAADVADHVALLHTPVIAYPVGDARHVEVARRVGLAVPDFDVAAVASGVGGRRYNTIGRGENRRAGRRGVVGAQVGFIALLDRMKAPLRVARTDAGIFEGRFQKSPAGCPALLVVIPVVVVLIEMEGIKIFVGMFEARRDNFNAD